MTPVLERMSAVENPVEVPNISAAAGATKSSDMQAYTTIVMELRKLSPRYQGTSTPNTITTTRMIRACFAMAGANLAKCSIAWVFLAHTQAGCLKHVRPAADLHQESDRNVSHCQDRCS